MRPQRKAKPLATLNINAGVAQRPSLGSKLAKEVKILGPPQPTSIFIRQFAPPSPFLHFNFY